MWRDRVLGKGRHLEGGLIIGRTLLIGTGGALVAQAGGLPAGALIGASAAVSMAAWARLEVQLPSSLRDLGFVGIGAALGAGIEPSFIEEVTQWSLSLAFLVVSLVVTLHAASFVLRSVFSHDRGTAVLAASPGTISYALAAAEEGRGDVMVVLVLQSLRLMLLTSCLPVLVLLFAELPPRVESPSTMQVSDLLAILGLSVGLGLLLSRCKVPAAFMVGGMIVSAMGHGLGFTEGPPPEWAVFASFVLVGTMIGTRFQGISAPALRTLCSAALVSVTIAAIISASFAFAVAWLTSLPFGQVWVAFAPGGVEAMAAIGIALGYDPTYVALHHIVRIASLLVLVPIALRFSRRPYFRDSA